ncbi:MAG: LysR family transcriptional regulator [Frisingicoccus sp.]|uniref:LysR family transcriptional regulator n=1 Tax=Frisingicoccus sp. TaxID=1918627 RepID=UPI0026017DEC|nr:LysR family transcriptional regulator [Frisingicoccus sp.]MDD6231321.1 LysR family transcriptional regulator [Frisingicoccus sp.]
MKLNQLVYFKYVCKFNNITKAAMKLNLSQPAVTQAIHDLEEELGVKLLNRTNRDVSPTNEGNLFLVRSEEILSQVHSLIDEMQDLGELRRTTVKIGIPPAIGTVVLPKLLHVAESLGIELEVIENSSDHTQYAVEHDELDLGIVLVEPNSFEPLIDIVPLVHTSYYFFTGLQSHLSSYSNININQLENEQMVMFYPGKQVNELFSYNSIVPKYVLHSNQIITIRNYLHASYASTIQFKEVFFNDPLIKAIPLDNSPLLDISLIKKRGRHQIRGAYQLFELLKDNPSSII